MLRVCPTCGACWLGKQMYWSTGQKGDPVDLASLVCRPYGDESCINPARDVPGGDTWEERSTFINDFLKDL